MRKVLLVEFNEICPPLLDRWMGEGKLPHFAALHAASQVFTTVADETDPVNLEPWIQWYSIHTGLPFSEHNVFHLTDGPKAGHSDIWQELHALGKSVMNCSSMNARPIAGERAFYLPDPWCATERAFPPELEGFKSVVSRVVQEYSRGAGALSSRDIASFLKFLVTHGLSVATATAIVGQLIRERISPRDETWKRVALLDRLQFDVFRHYYGRLRPDFATFFSNSTAHLQHAYWRAMDPDAFSLKLSHEELATYGDAVLFGYQAMDRLLRDFFALVDEETIIILCSALSQQPFLKRESRGGQHFYRLRDAAGFLRRAGVNPTLVEPAMTHQYMLRFGSPDEMAVAAEALGSIRFGGEQVFGVAPSAEQQSLYFGCQIYDKVDADGELSGLRQFDAPDAPPRFFDALYAIDATKSGCHHPDGVLWVRTGQHRVHPDRVSILDIPATIYDLMGVRAGDGMRGDSLVARFRGNPEARKQAA